MTVPGGDSGENAQDDTDQPRPEEAGAQPEQDTSPSGFDAHPGPPPGYPPPGYPPTPPGPPPGSSSVPGFGVPPGPHPGHQPPGPPPGYPPPPAGYPPSGYGPPYPGGYHQPYDQPRSGTNSLAITSLVVSTIGILPFCGGLLSIAGIVLGGIALNQIKRTGEEGYGLAVAGIAVGVVTLVIGIIITIFALPYRS